MELVPKVSIVMPVFNDAAYLRESLGSACNQTLVEIEVICVDDASTDGSREILEEFAACDERVKVLFHARNQSASQARKDGVAASRGAYVMFLDGDGELVPRACATALAAIERSGTDMVQFGTEVMSACGATSGSIAATERLLAPCLERIKADGPCGLVDVCWNEKRFGYTLWNKIYRGDLCRVAFEAVEDGSFPKAQDQYAFLAIAWGSRSYAGIEDKLYRYNLGRGIEGKAHISLGEYAAFLSMKRTVEAMRRFAVSRGCPPEAEAVLDGLDQRFLNRCVDLWEKSLDVAAVDEGFTQLVRTWGLEDVLCLLANKNWHKQSGIAKALARNPCFAHMERPSQKKPSIAFYFRRIAKGGGERVTVQLCNRFAGALDDKGLPRFKVILITDGQPQPDEYALDGRVLRASIPAATVEQGSADYRARFRGWTQVLDETGADIVVSGQWDNAFTMWDMLTVKGHASRPAFMLHVHSTASRPYQFKDDIGLSLIYLYRLCDGAAVLSEADKRFVERFCNNVAYIPNPVDYLAASPVAGEAASASEEHALVWTGRIDDPVKRCADLIYMMRDVVAAVPDARLYLVGDGRAERVDALKAEAAALGLGENIVFAGYHADVADWYRRARIFISTSMVEGFPLSIGEALSFSLPVVMYDIPWLTYVRDGRGIRTVEQGRYDLLAREVIGLFGSPSELERLGCEGRAHIDELARADIVGCWQGLFDGIDPEGEPLRFDEDERAQIQYMSVFSEQAKADISREEAARFRRERDRLQRDRDRLQRDRDRLQREHERELSRIHGSTTWKVGRAVTWLPRALKRALMQRFPSRAAGDGNR